MKFETVRVKSSIGEPIEGQIAVPETLPELLKIIDPERAFRILFKDYMTRARRRLASNRVEKLTLRVNDLSPEQQELLRKIGLLKRF
jgi:hypothetical protein